MTKRSWAISLTIHAVVLACLLSIAVPAARPPVEPVRWRVALHDPVPAVPEARAAAAPPTRAARLPSSVPAPHPSPSAETRAKLVADTPPPAPTQLAPAPPPVSAPVLPTPPPPEPAARSAAAVPVAVAARAEPPGVATPAPTAVAAKATEPQRIAPPEVDLVAQGRWHAALAAKLADLKRYPMTARRLGQEGVVLLEALVQPDGRAEVAVKTGSGHAALDRAALVLFQEALRALPAVLLPTRPSRLEVPIAYRLEP